MADNDNVRLPLAIIVEIEVFGAAAFLANTVRTVAADGLVALAHQLFARRLAPFVLVAFVTKPSAPHDDRRNGPNEKCIPDGHVISMQGDRFGLGGSQSNDLSSVFVGR
jgi:hypothetical protein